MPLLFWPLLTGTVCFVGGMFTGEALGNTLKILIGVLMALWLVDITGVIK